LINFDANIRQLTHKSGNVKCGGKVLPDYDCFIVEIFVKKTVILIRLKMPQTL